MHKLTAHPSLPGHYVVESGDCVPLAPAEGQRIARLFEQEPVVVAKSAIKPESRPVGPAPKRAIDCTNTSQDSNAVFDSFTFFAGLKVPARKSVAVSSEPEHDNDILSQFFPFIR